MSSRVLRHAAFAAIAIALAAGCGDLYSDPLERLGPTSITASGAFVDAAATIPRDFISSCLGVPHAEGSSCSESNVPCEYGSSPDIRCNTTLVCAPNETFGATWTARPSILCPTYACPSRADLATTIDGTRCEIPVPDASAEPDAAPPAPITDADELLCPLADGVCACTTGPDAAHKHERRWVCMRPIAECPTERPLVGSSCTSQRSCDYGSCEFKRGVRMECKDAVWQTGVTTCN